MLTAVVGAGLHIKEALHHSQTHIFYILLLSYILELFIAAFLTSHQDESLTGEQLLRE